MTHHMTTGRMKIQLDWYRDAHGYCLIEESALQEEARSEPPGSSAAVSAPPQQVGASPNQTNIHLPERWLAERSVQKTRLMISRLGGRLVPYRPSDVIDLIFTEFVNTPSTREGLLEFITRFGPLTVYGLDYRRGESLDLDISYLDGAKSHLESWGKVDRDERREAIAHSLGADGLRLDDVELRLVFDERLQEPLVEHHARDLAGALYLYQMLTLMGTNTTLRRCAHCGHLFAVGRGTSRPQTARFCCGDHRIRFNSLKRSTPKAA